MRQKAIVAEESEHLRRLIILVLEKLDFDVLGAGDGREALKLAKGCEGLSLLITELEMRRMGGLELATELSEDFPSLAVLYLASGPRLPPEPYLVKPFTLEALESAVREVIEGSEEAATSDHPLGA